MPTARFTIAVMDGDRVVHWPSNTTPTPNHSEVDVDVWPGDGPPATPPPPGCEVGDLYFDLVSGDVYQLDGD